MSDVKEFLDKLEALAAMDQCSEAQDFCAADFGQYDDAFQAGFEDGRVDLAREMILEFKKALVSYKINQIDSKKDDKKN